ncbi:UDP-N-acetylmuramoyl-L-alanyl-D-glutamate--2,6-diaminopimelate ligase [Candidatus Methanobinarius endosymbioticus]|uniref:UDP-N-acetylmuramoyl-L-alanyl-D-glutamate--2, 6-diaminopimelate ligase n=1 Tax=Candidatus Methanobinarius endosymbioticus TaxID=2006182 RepID=A0A366M9L0_9EURY|nr:UDP-N-acetylmuramoyl-L-alanyl-D-glutamate--2,6-diaminopimelate ligase [Candidatus Methanobinarius endosymbioticus]
MISGKNILIVGAGNAGRPVANLFNHLKNKVTVNDLNSFKDLPKKAQKKIKMLKTLGIDFDLGQHDHDLLNSVDAVYVSPNIPKAVDFIKKIHEFADEGKFDIIENNEVGKIINSLISIPMIGIAGTDGKTTTSNMINYALEGKFDTLIFSSLQNSLVIEGLVEMIVNSDHKNKELAIFELPHGTIRMVEGLELDACVVTNLTPDHMDEFNTYEEYIDRNIAIEKLLKNNGLVLVNGDDPIISKRLDTFTHDCIFYGLKNPQNIYFEGKTYFNDNIDYDIIAKDIELNELNGSSYKIVSNEIPTLVCSICDSLNCNCGDYSRKKINAFEKEVNIKVPGMINVENSLATILSSLIMGIDIDDAINRISNFNGVKGRFEKIDKINGINIFMDAAHNPESMEKLFNGLDASGRLILSLDNPDTLTSRNKTKIGEVLGKVADVLLVSTKNETTEIHDPNAASEVVEGAFNGVGGIKSYITNNVYESIFCALSIADEGDTILHIGPGVVNAYQSVKNDIKDSIDFYKAISGKVVVIGGCGTVGSLIARVLKANNIDVAISDSTEDTPLREVFEKEDIKLDLGHGYDKELLANASSFFLAPSLMHNEKLINNLKEINSNVPILGIDEIYKFFRSNKAVFGVTGTNGKTTTTEMLKNIFKTAGLKIPQHFLNIQGNTEYIPSLQSKLDGEVAVIEIGTFGNSGEIKSIAEKAEVDTGIITNITQDHLANGSFEDYIECKKEMVNVADNLILCGDDPIVSYLGSLKDNEDLLFFGINSFESTDENNNNNNNTNDDIFSNKKDFKESRICPVCGKELIYDINYLGHLGSYHCGCGFKNPELDVEALNISFNKENSSLDYILKIHEEKAEIYLKNGSIANVYNSLAVSTAAWLSGINIKTIAKGISSFEGVKGRLDMINENPKIIIDYAHNPAGVKSVMQTVNTLKNNNENLSKGILILVNTISSESGDEGDLEIAKLLSNADIIIPASYSADHYSNFIDEFNQDNCKIVHTATSKKPTKIGTLGASYEQVKEAIELALEIVYNDDTFISNNIESTTNIYTNKVDINNVNNKNNGNINNINSENNFNRENMDRNSINDIILIIGEGGFKYSQKILNEVDFDNKK